MVRRMIGVGLAAGRHVALQADPVDESFIITDGHKSFAATVIEAPETGGRLLMFVDEVPPRDVDLWVVRLSRERPTELPGARTAGGVICFTPGTEIRTCDGLRRIEDLRQGDRIQTKDNGLQEIIWTGSRRMTGARLYAMPELRPIRFCAGALGIGRPREDLLVSPQHRMLVRGPAAMALFNSAEVLIAAEHLVNDQSILVDHELREVTYVHILLERHQIIWANGLETESFHPSNTALDTIEASQRAGLLQLLPGLEENPHVYGDYARRNLSASEAAILRHDIAA
jgi:hypothetical protein